MTYVYVAGIDIVRALNSRVQQQANTISVIWYMHVSKKSIVSVFNYRILISY